MIRARIYGSSERMGKIKQFIEVDQLPNDVVKIRLDPEQRTGDDDKHNYYEFYHSESDGYVCIRIRENESDIMWDTVYKIRDIKNAGGNPLVLAKSINHVYEEYKARMDKNGFDEYVINALWEDIQDECDLIDLTEFN